MQLTKHRGLPSALAGAICILILLNSVPTNAEKDTSEEDFQLLKISTNQRLKSGDDTTLECLFDSPVTCLWFHQRISVDIEGDYSYLVERPETEEVAANGTDSDEDATSGDCSIRIAGVGESDFGSWQCQGSKGDDHIISPEILLVQNFGLEIVEPPSNVSAKLWDSATLTCKFNQRVQRCDWYRDTYLYELSYNAKFRANQEGVDTTDCSLELSAIMNRDLAQWQCSGKTENEEVRSNPVWIKLNNGLPVEERPTDVAVVPGASAILRCAFPQPGQCLWHHGGSQIRISGAYSFLDASDNTSRLATKNCSIVIGSVGESDYGDWTCQGVSQYGTHNLKTIYLTNSAFNSTDDLRLLQHPRNVSVSLGKPVNLHCRFDRPVDACHWSRGGADIGPIGTRYVHVGSDDGRNTHDCSVRLLVTLNDDFQSWQCSGTSGSTTVESQPIWINQQARLRLTEQPTQTSAQPGSNLTLTCKFNEPVQCVWARRGRAVAVSGRYAYATTGNDGVNTRDCSLHITDAQSPDFTIWYCKGVNLFGEKQSDIAWIRNNTNRATTTKAATISSTTTTIKAPLLASQYSEGSTSPPSSMAIYILICISVVGIVSTVAAVAYWRNTKKNTPYRKIASNSQTPLVRNANQDYFDNYQVNDSIFDDLAKLRFP